MLHLTLVKTKMKNTKKVKFLPSIAVILMTAIFVFGFLANPFSAKADRFDDQINALNTQNAQNRAAANLLQLQANSYQDAINKLQTQINAVRAAIAANEAKQAEIKQQIVEAEAELAKQKKLLGENIKQMYLEGDMSTLEMLASSKDLSDFVDKQQYRTAVQGKIKSTLDKITALKAQLKAQEAEVAKLLQDQEAQRSQLAADQAQQNQLLAATAAEKASLDASIRSNSSKISELRKQQAAENARFIGSAGMGPACGGGYPGTANSQWGVWGCNYPLDYNVDNWGMYNRECVSYTAFKVAASGRHMPYWGGYGNANQWDDNARASGIPVDSNPRPGDVAVSNSGYYGHVMYVEYVYDDGRILVSQYNADWTGRYSEAVIWPGNLVFIHF
jgi:peptidoglycan DL-endopeptidase CwlO